METYKKSDFESAGITENFVQDNYSVSAKSVLRGIHFQKAPKAQGKLVSVVKGAVWDVAVDLRPESPTYCHWMAVELNQTNRTMFYIPPGFGHAFLALEDDTHFSYKCTAEYSSENDSGIRWDDPDINISWPDSHPIVSDKDKNLPYLRDLE